jgi:hypothetical protein
MSEPLNEGTDKVPLLPYYVYLLLDPVERKPFYVGKGTGNRLDQHQIEADRKKDEQTVLDAGVSPKIKKFKDLQNQGRKPLPIIVGRYETESEAFSVEALLIHFIYGHANLTNIASGRGVEFIRSREEYDAVVNGCVNVDYIAPQKAGVDIERNNGLRTGEYRDENIRRLTEARAYDLLKRLVEELLKENFAVRDFSSPADRYFDPNEAGGNLGRIIRIGQADFVVQFRAAKIFKLVFIYTNGSDAKLTGKALEQCNIEIGEPKGGVPPKYSWLKETKGDVLEFYDIPSLIEKLKNMRDALAAEP